MKVLSLFDGLSGCRIALDKIGIAPETYYASEIDKYAIQVGQHNYPENIQLGDMTKWREWDIDFSQIDLLTAGFPCQAWSLAGKQKGDIDPRGALVHDLIDIWKHITALNPNLKFMFENVKMKKEFIEYINNLFGVEPIEINSASVSAQNRKRLYWTNIPGVEQPEDLGKVLADVVVDNVPADGTLEFGERVKGVTENYRGLRPHKGDKAKSGLSEFGRILKPTADKTDTVTTNHAPKILVSNVPISQPKDLGILLGDIIEDGIVDREKSLTVTTRVAGATAKRYLEKSMHQMVQEDPLKGYNLSDKEMAYMERSESNKTHKPRI